MTKKKIYISETSCITPLGFTVPDNMTRLIGGISGIKWHDDQKLMPDPFYAAIVDNTELDAAFAEISNAVHYTKLEKMMILALHPVIGKSTLNKRTAIIISTTKGNIDWLPVDINRAHLHRLAKNIAGFFKFESEPIVVSNACVSGILAISVAKRLIQADVFDAIYAVSGDLVSRFVLSGFRSFQAMSELPCRPYSKNRSGVTIGEAAAAVLVTSDDKNAKARILGDSSINDANHISGPSRTGEGLFRSIQNALAEAEINASDIDYISAHGTATAFNDQMEAVAFNRHQLGSCPLNSFKGYYGHTLGASGMLETVLAIESMIENRLLASLGFDESDFIDPINVIKNAQDAKIRHLMKTASGFGGCNTAAIFTEVAYG